MTYSTDNRQVRSSVKRKQRIAVITTSLASKSRSRIAGRYFVTQLEAYGATVDWIDLKERPLRGYPLDSEDADVESIVARVHDADAFALAFPIYNWSESGQTRDFLAYVLDKKKMKNKVCLLIAGCSTKASFLVPTDLSRTLQSEIGAVIIGPGILACGDDVDRETGGIKPELQERLNNGAELLFRFSKA